MKRIISAILLITFVFSNISYAQQTAGSAAKRTVTKAVPHKSSNNGSGAVVGSTPQYNYTWSTGSSQQVSVMPLATTNYSVSRTMPATSYVTSEEIVSIEEMAFKNKVAKLEEGKYDLDKAVKELVSLLLYEVEDTEQVGMDKMSALGTIDLIFSNNLLTIDKELKLILLPLVNAIGKGGRSEAWASIGLGLIVNYYPVADMNYFMNGKTKNSQVSVLSPEYNPRDPQYRTKIELLFKKYILNEEANINTRLNLAEGIGFDKGATWNINSYINKLNERLHYGHYTEGPEGAVVFSLCRALAYQATVYKSVSAKDILEKLYGGIHSKDQINNAFPWATMIYSAIAAGSYGITSAYHPLGVFAMWGDIDDIFETRGIKIIPFEMRKMAWSVLPEFYKERVREEHPDALYSFTEYDENGKEVQLDQPLYTSAEYWATSIVDGLNDAVDFLLVLVCWEIAGAVAMSWAVSAEFAVANSVFAEAAGYVATVGAAGRQGSRMAVAAYERWLIMNSAKYAVTFAETPVGILFNKIGKGIKNFFTKFAPQITLLKQGVVVTSTVINLNVATVSARTLPNVLPRATTEIVLSTAEKQTLNTATKIISSTPAASTMAESQLVSMLEKTGMDFMSATKYVNAFKSSAGVSIAPYMVTSTGGAFVQTTVDVIFDGKSNVLTVQSDIPGDATFTQVFKFKNGQVKAYSGLGGGGDEPPVILTSEQSAELTRLIAEYDKTCRGLI